MSPKKLGVTGLFIAFVVALPLFVWSAINVNFNVNKRAQGEPNFCGGTCGSNYNCQANYFCFEGFCRNPICSSDTDCVCNIATTTPSTTVTSKSTLKPTITPEPKGGNETSDPVVTIVPISTIAPIVYPSPSQIPEVLITTNDIESQILSDFIKYSIGILVLVGASIIGFIIWKKSKLKIPHILPPTNI